MVGWLLRMYGLWEEGNQMRRWWSLHSGSYEDSLRSLGDSNSAIMPDQTTVAAMSCAHASVRCLKLAV